MYTGITLKLDSYEIPLNDYIGLLRSATNDAFIQPLKDVLHEPGEFDDDKVVQYAKKKVKENLAPQFEIEIR